MTHKFPAYRLTALSGAGKTTLANAVAQYLRIQGQAVCVLDGDALRAGLCRGLGFSEADRAENMRRTAELAQRLKSQEITVIAALIAPSQFIGAYVNTPQAVYQQRNTKGLYAKARQDSSFALTGFKAPWRVL